MNLAQALIGNVGTYDFDVKGEIQVGENTRIRVPKQDIGADQLVVVRKLL